MVYKIGDKGPAGGWIFYDKGNSSDGWRYLEAAPEDQAEDVQWGRYTKEITGAKGTAVGTGKVNTAAIIKSFEESGNAAKIAASYSGGGKSDWFLPSIDELVLMFENLHEQGGGGFTCDAYWSSSDDDDTCAWLKLFNGGNQSCITKTNYARVRAVRAF